MLFVCFKQKTAYEMRISYWSSDVCSSDLLRSERAAALYRQGGPRSNVTRYEKVLPVRVDRPKAAFSAWYELLPRSQSGDAARHGTFDDVIRRLPYVRDLGFDVLYLPPIHPIGRVNRKGRNNALKAARAEARRGGQECGRT